MGIEWLYVLALALCAVIGVAAAGGGLYAGVRIVQRDEERYSAVAKQLDLVEADRKQLRLEWDRAIEALEGLLEQVEKKRRRIAASESRVNMAEAQAAEPEPMSPQQEREIARRKIRKIA